MSGTGRGRELIEVRVRAARLEAEEITSFELVRPDGRELPAWRPGAHIDVHLPSGVVRQYSLCGHPDETGHYRIAVLELPAGRGGSVEAHRELRPGVRLSISEPRNDFPLVEAERYVFVAGGIGITPLLPMIHEARRQRRPWCLLYGARSEDRFAFAAEIEELADELGKAEFVAQDVDGPLDLAGVVAAAEGALVYTCGPTGLMDALTEQLTSAGRGADLHLERFTAAPRPAGEPAGESFEVELASSGLVVTVGPDVSVLDALRASGVEHVSSCEMGICGTCETRVLSGRIDHRDDLLTEQERASGESMMICVSRAACPRLVLDL